jgi:hypothetical protein
MQLSVSYDGIGLEREMRDYFTEEIQKALPRVMKEVRSILLPKIEIVLKDSEEWDSLMNGVLREEFGIANPRQALDDILQAILAAVEVKSTPPRGNILGGIQVSLLSDSFQEVLSSHGASYTSVNKKGIEKAIPWLKWLLMEGNKIILTDYEINTQRASRKGSRTGRAIMVRPGSETLSKRKASRPSRPATGWGVPRQFVGTPSNNWLTRTLEPVLEDIESVIEAALKSI